MTRRDIITAVPVAFTDDGALDLEGSREVLRYVAASGNEGAFVMGTTGEFPSLSVEERTTLTRASVEELGEVMRVIVHVGAPSLREVLRLLDVARDAGATEVAVITPYYFPASDDALLAFYTAISQAAAGIGVYVYVFPERTGNAVSTEVMARLAQLPDIIGAKVSGEPLSTVEAYRAVVPDGFVIYTGSDRDLARAGAAGAQGVVSGISSVLPKPFRALKAAAEADDRSALTQAQADVDLAVDAVAGDIARMKVVYRMLGVPGGSVRMALDEPGEDVVAVLEAVVSRLG